MAAPTPITRTALWLNSGLCTIGLLLFSQLMTPTPSLPTAPASPIAQRLAP
ncbi:hypothetical protein [Synechococcus elongatus]|uniref:Uncharacterized protein n=2 Tax=Synechococcus elongatus TaxID=32046 RepID=A0AAQ3MC28_SYNEL|nr:hypothetical protein [Synechococcus elongatus]